MNGEVPADFRLARRKRAELQDPCKNGATLPPNSEAAEEGIIGCILLDGKDCVPKCQEAFKENSQVFYSLKCREIYEHCVKVNDAGIVDLITLSESMRRANAITSCGGLLYLSSLADKVPSAANLGYYVDIVREKYAARLLLQHCLNIVQRIQSGEESAEELMTYCEEQTLKICSQRSGVANDGSLREACTEHETSLEKSWAKQFCGLTTGFRELDSKMLGLGDGEITVIGAATSQGKSSLLTCILAANLRAGHPCGLFTLEMSREEVCGRLVSALSTIPVAQARKGMGEEQMAVYSNGCKAVRKWPLRICDDSRMTVAQIASRARRMVSEHGVELIGVDYVQLIAAGIKCNNRTQEVGHVSQELKAMARELQVPVIVLAQFSRDHKKENRRPRPDDLRESGSLEQDADKILLLHRPNVSEELTECNVAKHRNGPTGKIDLLFRREIFRFEELQDPGI